MEIAIKKNIFFILLILSSIFGLAQENNLYILIDSNKDGMQVTTIHGEENTIVKFFTMSKADPNKDEIYSLDFDSNGNLIKRILGKNNSSNKKLLDFHYNSDLHNTKEVLKINVSNFLDYETFYRTNFSNIRKVIRKATNLYVIDLAEEDRSSNYYTAYNVKL